MMIHTLAQLAGQRHHRLYPHPREDARIIAVQIYQRLKGLLLGLRELPIYRPFLFGLHVVFVEVTRHVAPQGI
jgi:hypothetical protein